MKNRELRFNRYLALLVIASFVICMTAIVLRVGIGATVYEATDSAGRTMGFNDPLSAEHYRIIVGNFQVMDLLKPEHVYEWILIAAHLAGAGLLLSSWVRPRFTRWFFALQAVVFPIGVPSVFLLPLFLLELLRGTPMDREGFIDIPFIVFFAHPVWIATSLIIVFALRGPGLGLAGVWTAIREGCRTSRRKFANAMLR